jgi:hypothetical protein
MNDRRVRSLRVYVNYFWEECVSKGGGDEVIEGGGTSLETPGSDPRIEIP